MANVYNCGSSWHELSQHCFCCHHGCVWVPPWRLTALLMGLFPLTGCNLEVKLGGTDHMEPNKCSLCTYTSTSHQIALETFLGAKPKHYTSGRPHGSNVTSTLHHSKNDTDETTSKQHWCWSCDPTANLNFNRDVFLVKLEILASIPSKNP